MRLPWQKTPETDASDLLEEYHREVDKINAEYRAECEKLEKQRRQEIQKALEELRKKQKQE